MTAPTPEQLRALAESHADEALVTSIHGETKTSAWHTRTATALRAAADQLEAVRQYAEANYSASTVARQIVRMMKSASDD